MSGDFSNSGLNYFFVTCQLKTVIQMEELFLTTIQLFLVKSISQLQIKCPFY